MKSEKNKNGIIALLVIIIIVLLALVVLLATGTINLNKNTTDIIDDNTAENSNKDDNITYNMVQSELIATVIYSNDPTNIANSRIGEKMYIVYPVINYNNNEINELNSKIKSNVNNTINEIINIPSVGSSQCEKFKIAKTGEEKNIGHFVYNEYIVFDNYEYLSIVEALKARTTCEGGFIYITNTYVVNKKDKSVLYNTHLVNKINKTELLEYIKNNYKWAENKDKEISSIIKTINENNFWVYYDNDNNVVVTFPRPEVPGNLTYKYDGKTWQDTKYPIEY